MSLITGEDAKAFADLVKPEEDGNTVVRATDDAAKPAPAPAPAATEPDPDPRIDSLIEANKKTLEALADLGEKLVERKVDAGDTRPRHEILADLEDESPAMKKLADMVIAQNEAIEKLVKAEGAREAAARDDAATQQLLERWDAERLETLGRFPGLSEADQHKVYDWMGKHPDEAVRVSWGYVAEKVLGMPYLEARRTPPGIDPAKVGDKPRAPSANVVTHGSGGSGGGGPAITPPSQYSGDTRTAFAEIRANPQLVGMLGKYD